MPEGAHPVLRHVPNALSTLRLGCAAFFPFAPDEARPALIVAAGGSDWLDGWIARRYGVTSWIGGLLDGLSDKAFVVTALVTLASEGRLGWWQLLLLLLRDVSVLSGVTVSALRRDRDAFRHMDSRTFGKLTTAAIFFLLLALVLAPGKTSLHAVLFWIAAALSAAAGLDYFRSRHRRILRGPDGRGEDALSR